MKIKDGYFNIRRNNLVKYLVFILLILSINNVYAATVDEILDKY